jgi:peptidoglycan/xylan/chitin deacetylase (PgdA/CDA1 family)
VSPPPSAGFDASGLDNESRLRRREERRRAIRRRRLVIGLVAGGVVAVAAVVALATGGSSPKHAGAGASGATARATATTPASTGAVTSTVSGGPPGSEPVPILMYHVIAAPPAGAPFPGLYVPPAEFAEQMQALKDAGWHAVTLDQVQANWSRGAPLGAGKPIVLSFDNGYNSQYTQALPVLRRLGWVGVENIQLSGLPPSQGGLGDGQVRGLLAAGWELDTQGFSHADLVTLDAEALRYQVATTRTVLQRRYGVPVNWFCYPSGHYNATVIAAVRAAGYTGSTTVVPGWAHPRDDLYRLHRLRVLGGTSAQQLLSLLASTRGDPPAPVAYTGG